MKVIYIAHSVHADGSAFCLLNILDGLSRLEKTDTVVVVPCTGFLTDELLKRRIKQVKIPLSYCCYPSCRNWRDILFYLPRSAYYILKNIIALIRLCLLIHREKPDLIHTNIGVIHVGLYAAMIMHIPHVWHIREYQDLDFSLRVFPSKQYFIKLLRHKNNYPIAISQSIFNHFKMVSPAVVIYDGVRMASEMNAVQNIAEKEYFLYVGSLSYRKGIFSLLTAFAEFAKMNSTMRLKIAGTAFDSMTKRQIIAFIKETHLENRIALLGQRSDIDVLMRNAKALIVPSFFEGFGRITPEALINYCPVIGRNSGGTAEILKDSPSGILFESDSEIVSAMMKICDFPLSMINESTRKAHDEAVAMYTAEKNATSIYNYYRSIIGHEFS